MSLTAILLTALALSMDAFAVSVTKGMTIKKLTKSMGIKIALAFGLFQGGMPIIGWVLGLSFEKYIKSVDHWIALILLSFLGYKMISEYIKSRKEENENLEVQRECSLDSCEDALSNKELIMLSIATSIDALAVGISFAFLSVDILFASLSIAIVTFLMCIVGVVLGNKIGDIFKGKAELIGGIILILIGINIFNEHTQILNNILNSIL